MLGGPVVSLYSRRVDGPQRVTARLTVAEERPWLGKVGRGARGARGVGLLRSAMGPALRSAGRTPAEHHRRGRILVEAGAPLERQGGGLCRPLSGHVNSWMLGMGLYRQSSAPESIFWGGGGARLGGGGGSPRILWRSIIPKLIETQVECLNVCLNLNTT